MSYILRCKMKGDIFHDEELEYDKKNHVKPVVRECINELMERFWVLKEKNEQLFYQIKDNEVEIKKFFRDTFRYRLISNHDMVKVEKIPVVPQPWMGEKEVKGTIVFKTQLDYAFFFWILAFLEGKNVNEQFSLRNICDYLQIQEEGKLVWKEGAGYQNRLSLVRTMKYAVKMDLIVVRDKEIEDFAGNDNHDVLFQRTAYSSYFMRRFQEDVTGWESLSDFVSYLDKENSEIIDRKHRYYRRLFLAPIVYHDELTPEEIEYIRNYYAGVDNNVYRFTDYTYERYSRTSMIVKNDSNMGENVFPTENMNIKLIMLFANYIHQRGFAYPLNKNNKIELTKSEFNSVISDLKKEYRQFWTKKMKQQDVDEIREIILKEMKEWSFLEKNEDGSIALKEGLFRFVGDYFNN
jgi:uncharacterized protein (TIGR02678 family)